MKHYLKPKLGYDDWEDYFMYVNSKSCNAEFTKDQKSFVVTNYINGDKNPGNLNPSEHPIEYVKLLVHDLSSSFKLMRLNEQLNKYMELYKEAPPMKYDFLTISPDDKYIATVVHGKTFTNLIEPGTLQLKRFNGTKPMFSLDGKFLLCIENQMIRKYLVDIEEIRRIVFDEKIFGELSKDYNEWVTY